MPLPVLFPQTGRIAMGKAHIPKQSLEHLALIEIRAHSGCEDTTKVDIEFAPGKKAGTNWHIVGIHSRFEKLECAARAVSFVHDKLRRQYDMLRER
jgi:hypothetical protein